MSFALSGRCALRARVRAAATIGLALVLVQVLLGLLNVALRLPIDLREAHAANAALVFFRSLLQRRLQRSRNAAHASDASTLA